MAREVSRRRQAGELRFVVLGALLTVVAVTAVTAVFWLFAEVQDVSFGDLSRDPSAVLGGQYYVGYFSNFTIFVWTGGAAAALFSAAVLFLARRRAAARFLLVGGLITVAMVVDDLFLVHETVGYRLGDREEIFFVAYGIAAVAFAWLHRRRLGAGCLLLLAAFGCWGASAGLDIVLSIEAPFIVEDGLKFLGVGLWSLMIVRASLVELDAAIRAGAPAAADTDPVPAPTTTTTTSSGGAVPDVPTAPVAPVVPAVLPMPAPPRHRAPVRREVEGPTTAIRVVTSPHRRHAAPARDADATTPVPVVPPRRQQRHDDVPYDVHAPVTPRPKRVPEHPAQGRPPG
jgi:hypothetical protein